MKGSQIKRLRVRLRWSQQKLAEFLGYSHRGTVSHIEKDEHGVGGPALRLLELLRLYDKHAGRLWDPRFKKRIKDVIKGEPDEKDI